jgi:hypothetical protein
MLTTYYYYHPSTFLYEGAIMQDYDEPPEHATLEAPESEPNTYPIWATDAWTYTPDYRGQWIYKEGETPQKITELGPIPDGWSLTPPVYTPDPNLEVKQQLIYIDQQSVRSLRAIAAGTAMEADVDKLHTLENEAIELRKELVE